jgi:drug/metabolite transporter (DMT)-like permease
VSRDPRGSPRRVALVLVAAIVAVSMAGTLVRLSPTTHPLVLAFWRVLFAGVALSPALRRLPGRDLLLTGLGSLFLALHFWTWFSSLHLTTVMRSTLLCCLAPVWCAGLEWAFLGVRPTLRFGAGVLVALAGVGVMVGAAKTGVVASVAGDGWAILAGMLGAAYFTLGRDVRARVNISTYGAWSCLLGAAWLLLLATLTGTPLQPLEPRAWAVAVGLAVGPQLIGHLGFNYAVGHLSAAVVATVILLEPVAATAVAAALLDEKPGLTDILGGVVTLFGVGLAVLPARRKPSRP